jgi:ERCC4-related helicase
MSTSAEVSYAPGSRVRIRGEEWAVEKCLPLPMGGYAVHVQGVSDLVRYHQAIFLTPLEKEIVLVRPEDTKLVADTSPEYRQTKLYLETLLRRTPPTHDKVAIGHRGALDVMPFQLVPAHRSLGQLRQRILIADGTGLGKTIEIGLLLSELIKRGRARRILVVAIRSMLAQLQRELWSRFTLPLVRLDSEGLQRVQAKIPANRNPFSFFDRVIVSMDTLKNHGMYRAWLEQIRWDVIVVDECHNVANQGSQRGDLARLLAAQCDSLILTSATPHNGRPESFANLMRMLDPTSIANPKSFTKEDVEHLYVRRFKKDVEREAGNQLRDRVVATYAAEATPEDAAALKALHALRLSTLGRKNDRVDPLVRWTLIKAYLSSPDACLESLDNRIANTRRALASAEGPHPNATKLESNIEHLEEARRLVERARDSGFGKLKALLARLRAIGFDGSAKSPRVVIFSERIKTLELLREALRCELKLKENAIGVFTADAGNDVDQRELVESFGHAESPLRVLLCSDAASEGVNLHHQCHHLFHFDVPWSLIRLTQRNGRIDRFGQHETPYLGYLVTLTKERTADQRVVERLIEKEKEVERQLGDAGALLGLYDAESEDDFLTRGIARGKDAGELLPDVPLHAGVARTELVTEDEDGNAEQPIEAPEEEPEVDLLALFAAVQKEQAATPGIEQLVKQTPTLFLNDYDLLVAALRHLENDPVVGAQPLKWTANDAEKAVTIVAPEPFKRHREPFLPREGVPIREKPYQLVMERDVVASKLRAALDNEGRWPDWHLLWEQHPLVDWLFDALGSAYARGQAPLLVAPAVGKGAAVFLLQGMLFNHEAEAVEARWIGVPIQGGKINPESLGLDQVMDRVGLRGALVNRGTPSARLAELQALVPSIVEEARGRVMRERQKFVKDELLKRARSEQRRLDAWVTKSHEEIEKRRTRWESKLGRLPKHLAPRLAQERRHIEQVKQNHEQLLRSLKAEGAPYIRLAAVFAGE